MQKVCKPGSSPVIHEACMTVHETSGALRNLGGTAEIKVFVPCLGIKAFLFTRPTGKNGILSRYQYTWNSLEDRFRKS